MTTREIAQECANKEGVVRGYYVVIRIQHVQNDVVCRGLASFKSKFKAIDYAKSIADERALPFKMVGIDCGKTIITVIQKQ